MMVIVLDNTIKHMNKTKKINNTEINENLTVNTCCLTEVKAY